MPKPPAKNPRPLRRKLVEAIHAFAEGRATTICDAAKLVGMTREAVSRALHGPVGQQVLANRLALIRSTVGKTRAQAAILPLSEHAKSEDVRLRASSWLEQTLGMGGTSNGGQPNGQVGAPIAINITFSRSDAPNRAVEAQPRALELQATVVQGELGGDPYLAKVADPGGSK